jgi:transmembrane sensor
MKKLKHQNRDRLEREAVTWHVRLSSGELTADDEVLFEEWRTRSPAHDQAYQKISKLWGQLGAPLLAHYQQHGRIEGDYIHKQPSTLVETPNKPACNHYWAKGLAIAASFMLLMSYSLYPDYFLNPWADYRTHIGEQTTINLADGSVIHLNTNSAINATITNHERHIDLLQGEAAFEVAHDSQRPFTVTSGQITTQAVGTKFLVRYDTNQGLITLLEGIVRTSYTGNQDFTGSDVILKPGEQVAFNDNLIGAIKQADNIAMADAWRKGRLLMNFVTLEQVVAEINRYRRGTVTLFDKRLAQRELNVAIDINQISTWLDALQDTLPLHVHRIGPVVVIKSE